MPSSPNLKKSDTLEDILEKLKKSKSKRSSFYLTLEDGRLTIGWLEEQPDETKKREERYLPIGESISSANVLQSIRSQI